MQSREVPWIFSLIWKGLKVYALLFFIWAGFVVWGNKEYIISEFARASKDTAPHEYRAPAGTKEVKLEDVKGVEEAKEELREFVEFLKDPMRFANLGGRPNKGILLAGPPGTGKTMLARAVANEAGVPFFYASGSEFEDKYVGVGAQKVKKLFATAKAHSPSIIFIDELDTIGGSREQSMEGDIQAGGSRGKQTLNMLLTEMDGFSSSDDVVVMAATNFPESLDAALTRPGRFDRHIDVPLPGQSGSSSLSSSQSSSSSVLTHRMSSLYMFRRLADVQGRLAILNEYMKGVKAADGLDLSLIARGTPGMSGADLENIVNQAAVRASKEGDWAVRLKHLDWSKDRSLMGVERKSRLVSEESLNTSAYIEGGHALVALLTPHSVPLHKVSILPRGTKLSTSQVPGMDQDSISKVEYLARLDVAVAGRVAEELVYGADHVSDRTYQDLSRASRAADAMVRKLGYSDLIGLVNLDDSSMPWLSKTKKSQIESETKRLVTEASERARHVLEENRTSLDNLAKALREHETLSAAQVKQVLAGEKVVKVVPEATPPRPPPPPPPPAPEEAASAAQPVEGTPTKEGHDRDKGMLVI
ncbi:P-loop containing nucleoside triphosphate hydrolase protein [Mrakia frigida]|uniref:ATP-dependent metallopeptidase FtsH/Yme1/Tma family protein n=1 Tax=Mrakia frigida TaxID=29902 RepID=UPI003FCC1884